MKLTSIGVMGNKILLFGCRIAIIDSGVILVLIMRFSWENRNVFFLYFFYLIFEIFTAYASDNALIASYRISNAPSTVFEIY